MLMEITSPYFILFSLVAVAVYYILNHKYRVPFLALLSLAFIGNMNYLLLPYVILYATMNYYFGRILPGSNRKILLYRLGLILNLTQLIVLKYATFTFDPFFELVGINLLISKISHIIVPIGISYFTLQGIGYLINIKMGWEKPEKNYADFLLYIVFFPKFLSGPIERSNHFLPQLKENKTFDEKQVAEGLKIILIGFFKKLAIANQLAPYVFDAFANVESTGPFGLWILFFLVPLYLYFDFSGYTDIAIGIAKAFGIDLLPNFNRPFFAENVTNFWKRFHISLASWFGDYIFRQTVFKRRKWGVYASTYAVFITWTLFGIWHGAGWNFMVLGFIQALAINYEFFTRKFRYKLFSRFPKFVNVFVGRIITYVFYCISLIFFFSNDLKSVFAYFSRMAEIKGPILIDDLSTKPISLLIYVPLFLLLEYIQNDHSNTYNRIESFWSGDTMKSRIFRWSVYSAMITIMYVVGFKAQQFVYADF
jgi:D-alanyl-lipoteichoic acid acyltransferase DltB (MBOAT superfamily)